MNKVLNQILWGNSLKDWLLALLIVGVCTAILRILQPKLIKILAVWANKSHSDIDDLIVTIVKKAVLPGLYWLAFFVGHNYLDFSPAVEHRIRVAFMIVGTYFVLKAITYAAQFFIIRWLGRGENHEARENHARGIVPILNGMLWIAGAVFLLDNLGYNVTTVITGLGIGGIAIALAAQAILADLFSYFVILFDRPVEIGDYIVIDDKKGTVEYIGLKTTRLRSLNGEQIILSNTNLTNARVHNFKRLQQRRSAFFIHVKGDTSLDILKTIPDRVKGLIENTDHLIFDRGHLVSLSPSAVFEFVYFVNDPEYTIYMDRQQELNIKILESFQSEGIALETIVPK